MSSATAITHTLGSNLSKAHTLSILSDDILAFAIEDDIASLRAISQTCQLLRDCGQRFVFRYISLEHRSQIVGLLSAMDDNPKIQNYIHRLHIHHLGTLTWEPHSFFSSTVPVTSAIMRSEKAIDNAVIGALLGRLGNVRALTEGPEVLGEEYNLLRWAKLDESVRRAVMDFVMRNAGSLRTFKVRSFYGMPIYEVMGACKNLEHLAISFKAPKTSGRPWTPPLEKQQETGAVARPGRLRSLELYHRHAELNHYRTPPGAHMQEAQSETTSMEVFPSMLTATRAQHELRAADFFPRLETLRVVLRWVMFSDLGAVISLCSATLKNLEVRVVHKNVGDTSSMSQGIVPRIKLSKHRLLETLRFTNVDDTTEYLLSLLSTLNRPNRLREIELTTGVSSFEAFRPIVKMLAKIQLASTDASLRKIRVFVIGGKSYEERVEAAQHLVWPNQDLEGKMEDAFEVVWQTRSLDTVVTRKHRKR